MNLKVGEVLLLWRLQALAREQFFGNLNRERFLLLLSDRIRVLFPGLRHRCGFREVVAEHVRVFQNPVDGRVHAQIFSGLL